PVADAAYLSRYILGLVKEQTLFEVNGSTETLMSKVGFQYDETDSIEGANAPVQHDSSYDGNFVTGRANLSSVERYDADDVSQFTMTSNRYNTAGAMVSTKDPLNHQLTISYADSFSANGTHLDAPRSFSTLAFPTTITDADGFSSHVRYHYDFGAKTRTEGPPSENQPQGQIQIFAYDTAARPDRITTENNGAYTRYVYGPNYIQSFGTVNTVTDEAYSIQIFDGVGRVTGIATNHPGSNGGYSAQNTIYDIMGRLHKQSNPTEVSSAWNPTGDDAAGWLYSQQSYDWQGRPRMTTNTDGTTKEASYSGCGCAGGAVVTLTDEGTMDAGEYKRRQQKIYSDVLGRTVKTEVLDWDGTGENGQGRRVDSTIVKSYNARDQLKRVRQFAGPEGSATYQDTTMDFDGYGRLKTKHVPEQDAGTATTWTYNADDTVQKVTDARGAIANFTYNDRHLIKDIKYDPSAGVTDTPDVSFEYDSAGNRTKMTDGLGSTTYGYNQLSRMTSESRTFSAGPTGSFALNYSYNLAGQLATLTEPSQFGSTFSYAHDLAGRLAGVTGSPFGGATTYASNPDYRAWGVLKHLEYGSAKTLDATYNSRLQAASFVVPGVLSKTYDYQADGRLRFSSDLLEHKYDRFYSFDHAARITQALSGGEARGEPATNDRPYKQTFSYDGLGHLTNRNSNHWNDFYSLSDSYTNNRRPDWNYDADGNLLGNVDTTYTYDAAGRIGTVGTYEPASATNRGLDGDGQQVRTDETKIDEVTQTPTTTTKYYLRSSVMGGQVLTEIDADGAKLRTFVYAGGSVLGWQVVQGTAQWVVWEHRDASGASFRTTDILGDPWGHRDDEQPAELDPTGSDAGLHAPLIQPDPPADEGSGSLLSYPRFSDPTRPGVTYKVDGIPVTVDYFMAQLDTNYHGSFSASPKRFSHYSVDADGLLRFDTWKEAARVARATTGTVIQNGSSATTGISPLTSCRRTPHLSIGDKSTNS
ncbi:MAG: hypothetical protein H7Z16_02820, partial [Pyrinomonadaceae bacterium]|nr:hypothetical protein [Pyrinomonadaceae bacterium]